MAPVLRPGRSGRFVAGGLGTPADPALLAAPGTLYRVLAAPQAEITAYDWLALAVQ